VTSRSQPPRLSQLEGGSIVSHVDSARPLSKGARKRHISETVAHLRARKASLSRSRSDDDPDYVETSRDLAAEVLKEHAERVVSTAPKLTEAQIQQICALLRGGAA
jgi:hypothetical protein